MDEIVYIVDLSVSNFNNVDLPSLYLALSGGGRVTVTTSNMGVLNEN